MDEQYVEIDADDAPAVEALISAYPKFTKVEDLPLDGLAERMKVVQDLWERRLLMTRHPLDNHYDD